MAELATIARPYAEALFEAAPADQAPAWAEQVQALGVVAGDERLRSFAENPRVTQEQVFDVITSAAGLQLAPGVVNFLRTVLDNGRLAALPEVATQFTALLNSRNGVSDAVIQSAFPIDAAQVAEIVSSLERRFGRKLQASVQVEPELIGGVRVVVGDEVLDTSVRAQLDRMRSALTA
ncbi:MAG: F0F1 ATP synthase subunit delta [Aquabacterium sp.]|jgi:F-type H+-transporting ATPase subunit delta|nr:MAG: F0F1 ATP synthase subunit delta [Aquabacterium sp.]